MDRKYKAELANVMELVSKEKEARRRAEEQLEVLEQKLEGRKEGEVLQLRQEVSGKPRCRKARISRATQLETAKKQAALDLAEEKVHAVKLEKQLQGLKQQKRECGASFLQRI